MELTVPRLRSLSPAQNLPRRVRMTYFPLPRPFLSSMLTLQCRKVNSGGGHTHPPLMREACALREGVQPLRSQAAAVLRAVCLGALHGPLTKSVATRSYFSNQMPRTFASKPDYSVRYWQAQDLKPVAVDVLQILETRV